MAVVAPSSSSPSAGNLDADKSDAGNPAPATLQDTASNPAPDSASAAVDAPPPPSNPNPNPIIQLNPAPLVAPPPPPPAAPSFRPLGAPPVPQYSTIPNPGFQGVIQPPGVSAAPVPMMPPGGMYPAATPGQPMGSVPMPYGQVPNGYPSNPMAPPQVPMGMMPPPGMPRYPYPAMMRPGFPPRAIPPIGMMPQVSRPLIPGVRGVPPVPLVIRPVGPIVPPAEKPQTTVYVGKIAPTVDNDFLLSVLKLCGPVKSWKRAQDPSDGTPKGFGFCEFESADGVLRSLRLLSKLSIDGQELVLNINQATREYLHRCVEKKTEAEKLKEAECGGTEKENGSTADDDEPKKADAEEGKKDSEESGDKQNQENSERFGIVTEEDREADKDALEKLTAMIEDRIRNKPLPPPPPVPAPADALGKSNSEAPSRSRDGDSDVDITKNEDKISDATSSENKAAMENEKPETSSPDRGRRHDNRNKERDRERDLKREKERELEKAERERERERLRRERERELKIKEAERFYKERLKDWEAREREKEQQRKVEKEREKERERERRKEISRQEDEMDDDDSRRRRRRSDMIEDKKRKRKREKEDDLDDRLKEEEEIIDAKRRAVEAQSTKDELNSPIHVSVEVEKHVSQEVGYVEDAQTVEDHDQKIVPSNVDNIGDENIRKSSSNDDIMLTASDTKQNNIAPARKLGFGLIGSGKRTAVVSVFHDEDDENVDEKKMRPLVPIDYSTEELQAVQTNASGPQANLVAAAEFAKHISGVNSREEKFELDKERNRHSGERSSLRERNRNDGDNGHYRDDSREKIHKSSNREKDQEDKPKTENRKLLDAKQLIDMIPKTKEELFIYEINWEIYDKHKLHERMRPWISKKITEFLGEEEETLVEYIVSSTKEHVPASQMLEILQAIFEDEAEMFVLKMWRMLIFEIKKVESGLSGKAKS